MKTRSLKTIGQGEKSSISVSILQGFVVKYHKPPAILTLPFSIPTSPSFCDLKDEIEAAIIQCLGQNNIEFSTSHMYRISLAISYSKDWRSAQEMLEYKISEFCNDIPSIVSVFNNVDQLRLFYQELTRKKSLISLSFAPLFKNEVGITPIKEIFKRFLKDSFLKNEPSLDHITNLVINEYIASHESENAAHLRDPLQFLIEADLFDTFFSSRLISSVINHHQVRIEKTSIDDLNEYLLFIQRISESEEKIGNTLFSANFLKKLIFEVNYNVFTSKLSTKIFVGLPSLFQSGDVKSLSICAKLSRATDVIDSLTQFFGTIIKDSVTSCFSNEDPMNQIMFLFEVLSRIVEISFGPSSGKILWSAFESGFQAKDTLSERLLAQAINQSFLSNDDSKIPQYVSIFRMLRFKDIFQSFHTQLLARRSLMLKQEVLRCDSLFIKELKKLCGPDYTKPMETIVSDVESSNRMIKKFRSSKKIPEFFRVATFSIEVWPDINEDYIVPPSSVSKYLKLFSQFFIAEQKSKNLKWCYQLTNVDMSLDGVDNINQVNCNGLYATVLLCFNSEDLLTIESISETTQIKKSDVESIINSLTRKRYGRLISSGNSLSINKSACIEGGSLHITEIPSRIDPKKGSPNMFNRESQIEANIMRVLKSERTLDKGILKSQVESIIKFKLDDEIYINCLKKLDSKDFLKFDPSGRIHYIP